MRNFYHRAVCEICGRVFKGTEDFDEVERASTHIKNEHPDEKPETNIRLEVERLPPPERVFLPPGGKKYHEDTNCHHLDGVEYEKVEGEKEVEQIKERQLGCKHCT